MILRLPNVFAMVDIFRNKLFNFSVKEKIAICIGNSITLKNNSCFFH